MIQACKLGEAYQSELYQTLEGFRGLATELCEIQLSKYREHQYPHLKQYGKEDIEANT